MSVVVKYQYATDQFGITVSIDDARRGNIYQCIGCDQRMVARRGEKVTHHFAHYRSSDCSGDETALHRIAKELIRSGYEQAGKGETEFRAVVDCAWVDSFQPHRALFNLRTVSNEVVVERQLPDSPYIPDILLLKDGEPTVIVEVEVSNPLSPEKATFYEQRELPVLFVKPNWDNVWRLKRGVFADHTMHVRLFCTGHVESERKRIAQERYWEQFRTTLTVAALTPSKPHHFRRRRRYRR